MLAAGNLDSMLNHYTASKKKRRSDAYTPGGEAGKRPDRATIVYCNRIRELWGDIPLIIGGVEASLRRFAHYDFWSDSVRRSVLADSRADLLVFGMGELASLEIAERLAAGEPVSALRDVAGTCWKTHDAALANDAVTLPSFDEVCADRKKFAEAFAAYYAEQDALRGKRLIQDQGAWRVVQNRPARPLTQAEMDEVYALPYARAWHPDYDAKGGVPALRRGALQHHYAPRMLRRVRILRHRLASGTDYTAQERRVYSARGGTFDERTGASQKGTSTT